MNGKRVGLITVCGAFLLALFVQPVAAQSASSVTERFIRGLNINLLYIALPITVLVEVLLIYTVWRFRNNEEPLPTMENRRLEITWTIATAIVLLVVGIATYQTMAMPYVSASPELEPGQDPVVVEVVGQKYSWTFKYDNTTANTSKPAGPENRITTYGTLVLPTDTPIKLRITSHDWLHSFHVPALGLKRDAIIGQHNVLWTKLLEEGKYQLYCAEYCGVGHSTMLGVVKVVSPSEYQEWLESKQKS